MAAAKINKTKRRRNRKARTDVSSSSSSSDSEPSGQGSRKQPKDRGLDKTDSNDLSDEAPEVVTSDSHEAPSPSPSSPSPRRPATRDAEQVFTDFYLSQATKEFANDLNALRAAGDFSENSLSILIEALKQGTASFSAEERKRIAGADG